MTEINIDDFVNIELKIKQLKKENKNNEEILEFILNSINTVEGLNCFIYMLCFLEEVDSELFNKFIEKARAKINNKFSTLKTEDITERMTEESKKFENNENVNIYESSKSNPHKI